MKISDVAIQTDSVQPGWTIRDVFKECVKRQVPVLPYCDASGRLVGRLALRHILRVSSIPDYAIRNAHLLGDIGVHPDFGEDHFKKVLDQPVEDFILKDNVVVGPHSSVQKVLTLMEKSGRNHALLMDEGTYCGVITRMAVVELILERLG